MTAPISDGAIGRLLHTWDVDGTSYQVDAVYTARGEWRGYRFWVLHLAGNGHWYRVGSHVARNAPELERYLLGEGWTVNEAARFIGPMVKARQRLDHPCTGGPLG